MPDMSSPVPAGVPPTAPPPRGGRGRRWVVGAGALVLLLAAGVAASILFRTRAPRAARDLLPPETLLAAGFTAPTDPAWQQVVALLRNMPGLERLTVDQLTGALKNPVGGRARTGAQTLPPVSGEMIFALLPQADRAEPRADGASRELPVDVLVLLPFENAAAAQQAAQALAGSGEVTRESTYRGVPLSRIQSGARTSTLVAPVGSFLLIGTRPEALRPAIDRALPRGVGRGLATLTESPVFERAKPTLVAENAFGWVLIPDLRALGQALDATVELGGDTPRFFAAALTAETEGFSLRSVSTVPDGYQGAPFPLARSLIHTLPQQLAGQWVSFYSELREPKTSLVLGRAGDAENNVTEVLRGIGVSEQLAAAVAQTLLPALRGQTAFLVAPSTDGRSPIFALVGEVAPEDARRLEQETARVFALVDRPGPFGVDLQSAVVEGVTVHSLRAPTPEVRAALGVSELAAAFPSGHLVLSTNTEAVSDLLRALRQPRAPLSDNALVRGQIADRPDEVLSFSYLFPGGVPGFIYGLLCDRSPEICAQSQPLQPVVRAALDASAMLLRVPRTVGSHTVRGSEGLVLVGLSRVQITPLAPTERASYETAVAQLKQFAQALQQSGALQQLVPLRRTPVPPQVRGEGTGDSPRIP